MFGELWGVATARKRWDCEKASKLAAWRRPFVFVFFREGKEDESKSEMQTAKKLNRSVIRIAD